jgi:hypothetical protein
MSDLVEWAARKVFPSFEWDDPDPDEVQSHVRKRLLDNTRDALARCEPMVMRAVGFAPSPIVRREDGSLFFHRSLSLYELLG